MSRSTNNLCIITTTKPPSILHQSSASSNNNSSIQILDPQTGSIISTSDHHQGGGEGEGNKRSNNTSNASNNASSSILSSTSIKISAGVGVHSLQPIVFGNRRHNYNTSNQHLYIAYGNQYKNKSNYNSKDDHDDMYAYLLVQGSSSSGSPKWKCKLPEFMSSGLITSPCGYYILGGGKSGTCYCWSTLSNYHSTSIHNDYRSNLTDNNNHDENDHEYATSTTTSSGSELVSKWVAHYRSIKSIIFSDCGSYIITGGDDGIVNVWSLMDVVSSSSKFSSYNQNTLDPIQTWSEHHLPITSMYALPSSRIVSTSQDKQLIIMELFNGQTLAKIAMPSSITTVISDTMGYRLYLGSIDGAIYCVDVNTYAIARTAESATIITKKNIENDPATNTANNMNTCAMPSLSGSLLEETVFGMNNNFKSSSQSASSHITEFRGHNRQISCLSLVGEDHDSNQSFLLVSGSVDGSIRVWDIRSRCCVHTISPWSATTILGPDKYDANKDSKDNKNNMVFPCSSITVIPRDWIESSDDVGVGIFFGGDGRRRRKRKCQLNDSLADLIKPLQRFTRREQSLDDEFGSNGKTDNEEDFMPTFARPFKERRFLRPIQESEAYAILNSSRDSKKVRENSNVTDTFTKSNIEKKNDNESVHEYYSKQSENENILQKEIDNLREEVARWKKVNNKLMLKLKKMPPNL